MSAQPPLLPVEIVRRVRRTARFEGISLLIVVGTFALISAALGDIKGAAVGLVIAGAGAIELHGASLLARGQTRGMQWLTGSQVYLLTAILLYVAWRLQAYSDASLRAMTAPLLQSEELKSQMQGAGITEAEMFGLLRTAYRLGYMAVGLLSFLYQGGMYFYYRRRREAVEAALTGPAAP